jgi:hypothetical protein
MNESEKGMKGKTNVVSEEKERRQEENERRKKIPKYTVPNAEMKH